MNQSTQASSDFSLSKWYMDCIDPTGNVFIGYSAVMKWKKLRLYYANILYFDIVGNIETNTSFRQLPFPILKQNNLTWTTSRLNIKGKWDGVDPLIQKNLLDGDLGGIVWQCFQPKANAKIELPNHTFLAGLGYTENLTMSIKPWELPITELRWGRFLSEEDTVVWISWKGEENLDLLYYQGNPVANPVITDDLINLNQEEFFLTFSDKIVLRNGYPNSTALSGRDGIKNILPKRILNTYECKWRSKGILTKPNKQISQGWVIHEVVKWD
jgi:hypothetical protein